jgi:hypothetical protein
MIIGAGLGALGSAAMGKSPFTGALMGGALGGLGGAGGLFGDAAATSAGAAGTAGTGAGSGLIGGANLTGAGVASGAGAGAAGGLSNFLSSIKGVETTPVSFGTGGYASGIGGQAIGGMGTLPGQSLQEALGYTIPKQNLADITSPEAIANSAFPKFDASGFSNLDTGTSVGAPFSAEAFANNPLMQQQIANNAGQVASTSLLDKLSFGNLSTMDKIGLGKTAVDVGFPNQAQQMIQPVPVAPITRGNPEMVSSPLMNVPPNVGIQKGNEKGLPNLMTRMPLTKEEEQERLRLQQLAQQGYRG